MTGLALGTGAILNVALGTTGIMNISLGTTPVWSSKTDVSDDFNRASLGSDWFGKGYGPGNTALTPVILSNTTFQAAATTVNNTGNQQAAVYTAAAATTDDMKTRGTTVGALASDKYTGLITRSTSNLSTFVLALACSASGVSGIYTFNGATATLRQQTNVTIATGSLIELSSIGNVHRLALAPDGANTTLITWTDTGNVAPKGASNRYGGLYVTSGRTAVGVSSTAPGYDNFRFRDN